MDSGRRLEQLIPSNPLACCPGEGPLSVYMQKTVSAPISGLALIVVTVLALTVGSACSRQPVYAPPVVQGTDAAVAVSGLTPDVPQFFTLRSQGRNISFFVIRMEGKINSFLDACASCYQHKRGYRFDQKDSVVTCRYCDMRFSTYKLEKGLGGCYPIKIEGRIHNETYFIPLTALQAAADKF